MLVWGGSSGADGQLLLDGAIYRAEDASWTPVSPAPQSAARRQGRIVTAAGGLVVIGGGDDRTGDPSPIVAAYDVGSDTWRTVDLGESVLDIAATPGGGVVALTGSLRGEELHVVEIDAAALASSGSGIRRATVQVPGGPSAIGVATSQDAVVVAVKSQPGRLQMREYDPSSWALTREIGADETPLQLGVDLLYGREAMPFIVSGEHVLAASQFGIDEVRLDGASYERLGGDDPHRFCAAPGAAHAWTGSEFVTWGGEGCGSESTPSTASGAFAAVRP
jgi:hypothetical protein